MNEPVATSSAIARRERLVIPGYRGPKRAGRTRRAGGAAARRPAALVLRARGIGDLLTAVPALRAMRQYGLRVVLACPPELSELAALTGAVDRLLPVSGLEPLRWPGSGEADEPRDRDLPPVPDIAINLHGGGPDSHKVLLETRPGRMWAFACDAFPDVKGPEWDAGEDDVTRWCRLVEWYGVPADHDDLLLPTPMVANPAQGAVVIHPGAQDATSSWSAERFAELARAISVEGHDVVVTGNHRERPMALLVATRAVLPPRTVLAGRTSLRELCAVVSGARLVISGDPGMAHLATSYGTPSVALRDLPDVPAGDVARMASRALTRN